MKVIDRDTEARSVVTSCHMPPAELLRFAKYLCTFAGKAGLFGVNTKQPFTMTVSHTVRDVSAQIDAKFVSSTR